MSQEMTAPPPRIRLPGGSAQPPAQPPTSNTGAAPQAASVSDAGVGTGINAARTAAYPEWDLLPPTDGTRSIRRITR